MKARIKPVPLDKLLVRDTELNFNSFNERDLLRWQEVGAAVNEKYPDAMELDTKLADISDFANVAEKYEQGTKAFCELFSGVFGEDAAKQLLGEAPYFGLCMEVYYEILAAIERQGHAYGQKMSSTLTQFTPTGPSGSKQTDD